MAKSPCVTRTTYAFGKDRKSGLSFLTLGLLSISSYRKACALEGNSLMNAILDRSWRRDQGGASESSEFADVTCGMGSCSHTPKHVSSVTEDFFPWSDVILSILHHYNEAFKQADQLVYTQD